LKRWPQTEREFSHVVVGQFAPGLPASSRHQCRECQREVWLTPASQRWLEEYKAPVWCPECASGLDEAGNTVRLSLQETLLKLPDTSNVPKARGRHVRSRWPWEKRRKRGSG
jgi:hypothetical protein